MQIDGKAQNILWRSYFKNLPYRCYSC